MELNENIKNLVESDKYTELSEAESSMMSVMLKNTFEEHEKILSEGSVSADIATFTPIIMPLVRRVYPNLIANELLGVQPMALPTGFMYALTNRYIGNQNDGIAPNRQGQILYMDSLDGLDTSSTITDSQNNSADVKYIEPDDVAAPTGAGKVLVEYATVPLVVGSTSTAANILAVYTNEASFGQILKNYTGPVTTAEAEVLGDDMSEVGFEISRKSVEAKSRALKGKYSIEMYQDLKSQHGLAADEEMMNLISYEVQAELDREIVDFVNKNATQVPNALNISAADGRWEVEKYRAEVIKIKKEANIIGIETKRGQGNVLVVSPSVATMLDEVGSFKIATKDSSVKQPIAGGVAGVFDNRFKVIVDQYSKTDYATVLYKGADRRDAMGFFAPYVPLSFTKVTSYTTGQPAIIAKTRYALETIPGVENPLSNDRAKTYARSFGVDFTGTALAS